MLAAAVTSTADLAGLLSAVRAAAPAVDDADRIERIRLFEELKSVAAAAQASETAAFCTSQRAEQAASGLPIKQQGRGVAAQVALAARISPARAQRYVGWARILTSELPATFAALRAGQITEWRAIIVARETIWLSRDDRLAVDAELGPQLEAWGDRRIEAEAKKAAYRLDPHGFVDRTRGADSERHVSLRPAPDTMSRLGAFLPVAQGVAAHAALGRHADTLIAAGDSRSRGQLMADTLVERLTGQATAAAVPVEIELVMTDRTLLAPGDSAQSKGKGSDRRDSHQWDSHQWGSDRWGSHRWGSHRWGSDEPATLVGFGPIPAGLARELALGVEGDDAPRWLRRLFLNPTSGQLAAMESTRRLFPASQRRFIRFRDHTCRTPWCDAPIRHADHIKPAAKGGSTRVDNGQGLCQACNFAKQAPGWYARTVTGGFGEVMIITPTGHLYRSRPPDPPRSLPPDQATSRRAAPECAAPECAAPRRCTARCRTRYGVRPVESPLERRLSEWLRAA